MHMYGNDLLGGKSRALLIYKNTSFQQYFPSATGCGSVFTVLFGFFPEVVRLLFDFHGAKCGF